VIYPSFFLALPMLELSFFFASAPSLAPPPPLFFLSVPAALFLVILLYFLVAEQWKGCNNIFLGKLGSDYDN
jgi:hypothetical protein